MNEREKPKSLDESVEAAVLDADLFVKYNAPQRAVERLQDAIAHHPRSIVLREKLREVAVAHGMEEEAARQCLKLVQLYISRENFESTPERRKPITFAGDLSTVTIFDAVQVLENSKLTGALAIESAGRKGSVFFNDGRIVDAECDDAKGTLAFRLLVEVTGGGFDFEKAPNEFPVRIQALSNTNLILDTLRQMDEEKNDERGMMSDE